MLIEILEVLPPTNLGLLVDAFRYISENNHRKPKSYDKKFLQTILASHEIYFIFKDKSKVDSLFEKYENAFGKEQIKHVERFTRILSEKNIPDTELYFKS